MKKSLVRSENAVQYKTKTTKASKDDEIIAQALAILEQRIKRDHVLDSLALASEYLITRNNNRTHEVFSVLYLDANLRLIAICDEAVGGISGCQVDPVAIIRKSLELGACSVILSHNHPSGDITPSQADKRWTEQIFGMLSLFDIVLFDHIIVGGGKSTSMQELGLIN